MREKAQLKLEALWRKTPRRKVEPGEKVVIFSDLHMADGSATDGFVRNSALCLEALAKYYLPRNYTLVLNGDIEELLRADRAEILRAWKPMYDVFEQFRAKNRLVWLFGNHEIVPDKANDPFYRDHFDGESVILEVEGRDLFVFHGHQPGVANSGRFNRTLQWLLRSVANRFRIPNGSFSQGNERKFKLEKDIYEFSRQRGVLSIMGHTHRPLFESLSKQESAAIKIERLCREFSRAEDGRKDLIRKTVRNLRRDYLDNSRRRPHLANTVYGELPVPCVFNSGCAIGKRGMTVLELKKGKLALVFWSNPQRSARTTAYNEYKPSRQYGEQAYRTILRRESLAYIYSRIELLRPS